MQLAIVRGLEGLLPALMYMAEDPTLLQAAPPAAVASLGHALVALGNTILPLTSGQERACRLVCPLHMRLVGLEPLQAALAAFRQSCLPPATVKAADGDPAATAAALAILTRENLTKLAAEGQGVRLLAWHEPTQCFTRIIAANGSTAVHVPSAANPATSPLDTAALVAAASKPAATPTLLGAAAPPAPPTPQMAATGLAPFASVQPPYALAGLTSQPAPSAFAPPVTLPATHQPRFGSVTPQPAALGATPLSSVPPPPAPLEPPLAGANGAPPIEVSFSAPAAEPLYASTLASPFSFPTAEVRSAPLTRGFPPPPDPSFLPPDPSFLPPPSSFLPQQAAANPPPAPAPPAAIGGGGARPAIPTMHYQPFDAVAGAPPAPPEPPIPSSFLGGGRSCVDAAQLLTPAQIAGDHTQIAGGHSQIAGGPMEIPPPPAAAAFAPPSHGFSYGLRVLENPFAPAPPPTAAHDNLVQSRLQPPTFGGAAAPLQPGLPAFFGGEAMAGNAMELEPLEPLEPASSAAAASATKGPGNVGGLVGASADELLMQLSSLDAQHFM